MASVQNTTSYVKFVRGTIAAWEVLNRENQVKDDTLYFIYESTTSDKGLLYLGTKQIGGTLNGDTTIPEVLDDLKDVIIDQTGLSTDNILVYNGSEWINAPFIDLLKYDGNVLDLNGNGALTLRGFEESEEGAIPQKDDSGLITWIKPGNLPEITEMAEQLEEVYSLIASMDHLSYKKVGSLDDINVNADKAANYIYLVPTEDNTNKYNEYMVIDNTLEPVGTWDVNLENYVTSDTF
jgi:hypothetical protein